MKLRYRERAIADLEEIFEFLQARNPDGARKVLSAIHEAVKEVAERPLAWRATSDPAIRSRSSGNTFTKSSMLSMPTPSKFFTFGMAHDVHGFRKRSDHPFAIWSFAITATARR
jgi:hypothetical protein